MFWKKKPKKTVNKSDDIKAQAQKIMAAKREEIGSETLNQIQKTIMAKQSSVLEKSKRTILNADEDKVRDNLSLWLKE